MAGRVHKPREKSGMRSCIRCRTDKQKVPNPLRQYAAINQVGLQCLPSIREWPDHCSRCESYHYSCSPRFNTNEQRRFLRLNTQERVRFLELSNTAQRRFLGLNDREQAQILRTWGNNETISIQQVEPASCDDRYALSDPSHKKNIVIVSSTSLGVLTEWSDSSFEEDTATLHRNQSNGSEEITHHIVTHRPGKTFDLQLDVYSNGAEHIPSSGNSHCWNVSGIIPDIDSSYELDGSLSPPNEKTADTIEGQSIYHGDTTSMGGVYSSFPSWSDPSVHSELYVSTPAISTSSQGNRSPSNTVTRPSLTPYASSPPLGYGQEYSWAENVVSSSVSDDFLYSSDRFSWDSRSNTHQATWSGCSDRGFPAYTIPSNPSPLSISEQRLFDRIATLWGNQKTYTTKCSPRFSRTLAEFYRVDCRQAAHPDFGHSMVKHALLVCMAADALITIQKLSKKRSLREKEIIYERKHIEIFEKHWNTAYLMLSNGMDELREPPNPDDPPPVKPLMYTCYLLGVAAVCAGQAHVLAMLFDWYMDLRRESATFPFLIEAEANPRSPKGISVRLRLADDHRRTDPGLEVGRSMSVLCKQRWQFDLNLLSTRLDTTQ